jgi:hypothetical protein
MKIHASSVGAICGKRFANSHFVSPPEKLKTVGSSSPSLMEAGDTTNQHLSASERQMQALTANIQELARQSAADRREMQELAKQNQEPLQENRSMATKPFRRTKVSISSLDVLGDEIVH